MGSDNGLFRPVFRTGIMSGTDGAPYRAGISTKGILIDPLYLGQAHQCRCSVRKNDVVLVGSSGLFHNVRESEIIEAVANENPHRVVPSLMRSARRNWFAPSDITCIVGVVHE